MSVPESPSAASNAPPKNGRRRFLGAGTAVAPALLTLAGQPALGATCFTPSRNLSKNTSVSQNGKDGTCTGTGVAGYAGGASGGSVNTATATFHTLFAGDFFYVKTNSGDNTNGLRSCTLLEVLNLNTATLAAPTGTVWCTSAGVYRAAFVPAASTSALDTIVLAKHMVAAYLNCIGGKVPNHVLKATGAHPSCTDMWLNFINDGLYEVMAGVTWNASAIKDYLISNGIAPA